MKNVWFNWWKNLPKVKLTDTIHDNTSNKYDDVNPISWCYFPSSALLLLSMIYFMISRRHKHIRGVLPPPLSSLTTQVIALISLDVLITCASFGSLIGSIREEHIFEQDYLLRCCAEHRGSMESYWLEGAKRINWNVVIYLPAFFDCWPIVSYSWNICKLIVLSQRWDGVGVNHGILCKSINLQYQQN